MRRFYAPPEQFQAGHVVLSPEETRHLRDVLRLRVGEVVNVFDGDDGEFSAEIVGITRSSASLRIISAMEAQVPESSLRLTIAPALVKGEKFDLIVQKGVELGVSKVVPLITERCDVRPRDGVRKAVRWRKIALEATKQCGRTRLTEIMEPVELDDFIDRSNPDTVHEYLFFSERLGKGLDKKSGGKRLTALFGPEGGWADSEIKAARNRGFSIVTLGGRTMRAETAAIAITAILQHRFGDIN